MPFGHRLRAMQSSRSKGDELKMQQQVDNEQQEQQEAAAQAQVAQAHAFAQLPNTRQHLRLDGDVQHHERSASGGSSTSSSSNNGFEPRRRGNHLSGSLLETRSAQDLRPHHHTQQQQVRQTRGMTVASNFLDEHSGLNSSSAHDSQQRRRRGTNASSSQYSSSDRPFSASRSTADSDRTADAKIDILYKGHLMVKRGLLKGLEKRFYFLTKKSSDLYCCKDETSFNLWLASGWALNAGNAIAKGSGLAPVLVCSVVRADRAGESGGSDRAIVLVTGSSSKCTTLKFYTETAERCDRWIRAFHRVQASRRASDADPLAQSNNGSQSPHSSTAASSSNSSSNQDVVASPRPIGRKASRSDASQGSSSGGPRAYAGGQLRAISREDVQSTKSSSSASDISEATSQKSDRGHGGNGTLLSSGAGSQGGNVLLFVPAAGSTISVSDSKVARARKDVEELIARGSKRPTRRGMDSPNQVQWRYGPPEYILSDLAYMQGKQREHESTPLESYVEECCQTFLMEATHKADYSEWISVRQEYFYLQVNDGQRIAGHTIEENDMFGLLFVNGFEVTDIDIKEGEEKDPRAILAEAFTEGFPMEVLEVYTQPPQCYFSWRHWGPFTGRYKGVKGDGSVVELRGFGQMQIDSNRMLNLRLFFKPKELFDALKKVSERVGAKTKEFQRARGVSSAIPPVPATSPATAPANPPAAKSKTARTVDIMNELANFTIASSKESSK